MEPPLIDSHSHLADDVFAADVEGVIQRAQAAGVTRTLCILEAGNRDEAARVARLRALWPAVRFSAGIHPHHAGPYGSDPARVTSTVSAALRTNEAARALGEIGLDYHYDFAPREVQHAVFRTQIQLAQELDLPVVIHTREADADTTRILGEENRGALRGVFHCFTGDGRLAAAALDLGFYLSFSGIVTFPRADGLREVAKQVPRDRYLVETDSPYLAPPPHRGQRNEPALVARVVEVLATVRETSPEVVAAETTANFEELFRP
ncbi:MAG: YchF/TatD family DNA exonuclease [Luteitalea sp.]|nr:YchF/TatD family DNA exonuclease [Luteitalea sp.]